MVPFFVTEFSHIPQLVPYLLHFSQMVIFLFYFFRTLLKYVVPFSKPPSASVPFDIKNSKGGYIFGGSSPHKPLGGYKNRQ